MKVYVGVDVQSHIFLSSALVGGESGQGGEEKILDSTRT
jgi:hypothetical protein